VWSFWNEDMIESSVSSSSNLLVGRGIGGACNSPDRSAYSLQCDVVAATALSSRAITPDEEYAARAPETP
jgi:hypothetical protein